MDCVAEDPRDDGHLVRRHAGGEPRKHTDQVALTVFSAEPVLLALRQLAEEPVRTLSPRCRDRSAATFFADSAGTNQERHSAPRELGARKALWSGMSTWQSEMVCAKNCITEILMCN